MNTDKPTTTASALPENDAPKIARIYLRDAIEQQLKTARDSGADKVYFGALAVHPQADEDCTFGELIDMLDAQDRDWLRG